jgi:hypothetical protein
MQTSSARRLHVITEHVSKHSQPNHQSWQAWAFAVQDATIAETTQLSKRDFFSALPKLWNLTNEVLNDAIEHYESNTFPLLHSLEGVSSLLLPGELVKPAGNLKEKLEKDRIVWGLDALAFEIDRSRSEQSLPTETLVSALESLSEIMSEISGDESIDPGLRIFLAFHLKEVHGAIVDYRISGISAIAQKVQQATGAIVLSEEVRKANPEERSMIDRAVCGLTKVNQLLDQSNKFVLGGKMILGTVAKILP